VFKNLPLQQPVSPARSLSAKDNDYHHHHHWYSNATPVDYAFTIFAPPNDDAAMKLSV
jgi:hypothetical protein